MITVGKDGRAHKRDLCQPTTFVHTGGVGGGGAEMPSRYKTPVPGQKTCRHQYQTGFRVKKLQTLKVRKDHPVQEDEEGPAIT